MANEEHLKILKSGVKAWNRWQTQHLGAMRGAILMDARMGDADLQNADLRDADLRGAELSGADLRGAQLSDADLHGANLQGANLSTAFLLDANLNSADLRGAHLYVAFLHRAQLNGANLRGADLLGAQLNGANLSTAHLLGANLRIAILHGADLRDADLRSAELRGAELRGANLSRAIIGETVFANVDLSEVIGMEAAKHLGPSTIGLDTLYKSSGKIPDQFLRDAGVAEDVIEYLLPLIRSGSPIQWHSCFISYSSNDEDCVRRLHARMRAANLRVWFAPEDIKGGHKLHEQLFDAIQFHDKLLLVLSENSLKSEWVMTEIRKAREVEKKEKRRKLFPIRLCDFDTLRDWTCFDADSGKDLAVELREYFIPDFSNWKDHDAFEAAFKRLHDDLKVAVPRA